MTQKTATAQTTFNSGELTNLLWERVELKYFSTGCSYAENVRILPQGGFTVREGLRDIGAIADEAGRLFAFKASNGQSFDIVVKPGQAAMWSATAEVDTVTIASLTADMLPELTAAQSLDTMLLFHRDLKSQRIRLTSTDWLIDDLPYDNVPSYDYGADIDGNPYSNAVPAEWTLEFVGLLEVDDPVTTEVENQSVFTITISGQETTSIKYVATMATLATTIEAALLDLPNISPGLTVAEVSGETKVTITFSGDGNEGDGWAVSGSVINKADAAVLSVKSVVGVAPGEDIISDDRGWPQCGAFFNQRLLVGGLRSLPNAWMMSDTGDYYNFDERLTADSGPAVIPMDAEGGESIEQLLVNRYLGILTSAGEYWISDRALSRNAAPNHVKSSTNGTRRGVPAPQNEGAAIYCHENGGVISEFRYTDVEGNFVSTNISLLAPHLVTDVVDMALRRATTSTEGNRLFVIQSDGQARMVTILREQEITAFTRLSSREGLFIAASVNGRNEAGFIVERPDGRRLERLEDGLLLDEAVTLSFAESDTVAGLTRFEGRTVWAIADNDVFGPFTVTDGEITLPVSVTGATVGTWLAPTVKVLPPSRELSPGAVQKRKGRIFKIWLSLVDTTSVAIACNDGTVRDLDLSAYGMTADVAELSQGFTGTIALSGFLGFVDEPIAVVTQLRPGRLTVRSITIERTA